MKKLKKTDSSQLHQSHQDSLRRSCKCRSLPRMKAHRRIGMHPRTRSFLLDKLKTNSQWQRYTVYIVSRNVSKNLLSKISCNGPGRHSMDILLGSCQDLGKILPRYCQELQNAMVRSYQESPGLEQTIIYLCFV